MRHVEEGVTRADADPDIPRTQLECRLLAIPRSLSRNNTDFNMDINRDINVDIDTNIDIHTELDMHVQ